MIQYASLAMMYKILCKALARPKEKGKVFSLSDLIKHSRERIALPMP